MDVRVDGALRQRQRRPARISIRRQAIADFFGHGCSFNWASYVVVV
jgi:hypothetical protein